MNPNNPITDVPAGLRDRLAAHIAKRTMVTETGCHVLSLKLNEKGYARFTLQVDGRQQKFRAHRVAWILANGPIEDAALVLDHLCRNRACINVDHLELVTSRENHMRGLDRYGRPLRMDRTSCKQGHSWPEHMSWVRKKNGQKVRRCLECLRVYRRSV